MNPRKSVTSLTMLSCQGQGPGVTIPGVTSPRGSLTDVGKYTRSRCPGQHSSDTRGVFRTEEHLQQLLTQMNQSSNFLPFVV